MTDSTPCPAGCSDKYPADDPLHIHGGPLMAVPAGHAAAVVPNRAAATSGTTAKLCSLSVGSLIVASFLRGGVPHWTAPRSGRYGQRWLVSVTLTSRLPGCRQCTPW